jgi:hypothetical protein
MASRGAHVQGTNGQDHAFRETVSNRYILIVELRKKLRAAIKYSVGM